MVTFCIFVTNRKALNKNRQSAGTNGSHIQEQPRKNDLVHRYNAYPFRIYSL